MKNYVILISCIVLLAACNRKEFKSYVGTYQGNEGTKIWGPGIPTVIDIQPVKKLEVRKDGKYINVRSEKIHIKDLEPNQAYYIGEADNHFTLKFTNDSVYFYSVSGSSESGSSYDFRGAKID